MKIKLSQERDVQILTATETVSPQDVQILKAGINKLFRNGKNKIILDLTGHALLPNEIIRELAILDVVARELHGRVVLAGLSSEAKTRIELFAKPPVVPCYQTIEEAIKSFYPPPAAAVSAANPSVDTTPAAQTAPPAAGIDAAHVAGLEAENLRLKEQIRSLMLEQRIPPSAQAYKDLIRDLETQLEDALKKVVAAAPKK